LDLQAVLDSLRSERKIFHSEADFQHALAWKIHALYPTAHVRLEYPWGTVAGKRAAIDILITVDGQTFPIELKYAKRDLCVALAGEEYNLPHQGAKDITCYDHIKDICRVERFIKLTKNSTKGYILWLSNDLALTKPPRDTRVCYYAFSIHEGAEVHGTMQWGETAGAGTTKGREEPLMLDKSYTINWHTYSDFGVKNGLFKYVLLEI